MATALLDLRRVLLLVRVAAGGAFDWAAYTLLRRRRVSLAVRVREALETLGLTYVKLGQFLAMRFDVLPAEVCEELSRLFENAQPVAVEAIITTIEEEFGAPLSELFAHFEPTPLAAASIAQVHEARTHAGARVAVKVQRPGAQRLFEADMRNLHRMARLADLMRADVASTRDIVAEFEAWTRQEFDFLLEGANAERLRARATPLEMIPGVYWPLTTRRVLTLEFVDGVSAARLAALRRSGNGAAAAHALLPGYDARLAAHRLAEAMLQHIFVDGFFHADVHPGNVFIRADNTIALLDFGITGELPPARRALLTAYYQALATGRIDECLHYYVQLWKFTPESDVRGFLEEMRPIVWEYYRNATDPGATVESAHWGRVTNATLLCARRHRVRSSLDLLLFFRAVGGMHTTFIVLGADFFAELRSFLVARGKAAVRQQIGDALAPRIAATIVRNRIEVEVRLAHVMSRIYRGQSPGTVKARRAAIGGRERALAAALLTVAIVPAASGAVTHASAVGAIVAALGALVLSAMIAQLLLRRRELV